MHALFRCMTLEGMLICECQALSAEGSKQTLLNRGLQAYSKDTAPKIFSAKTHAQCCVQRED